MRVAAVVVSHNRKDLLRTCLHALLGQTVVLDAIIVVDNASSDGAVEMMELEFGDALQLIKLGTNRGGSAGFSMGVEIALEQGFDYIWLMDDDAAPRRDALAPLLESMLSRGEHSPGFVASTVVDLLGVPLRAHWSPRIGVEQNRGILCKDHEKSVPYATFVGVLVNGHVANRTWLPVADFFLWWDDTEYTSRLQRLAGGLLRADSLVEHPEKPELRDLGPRFVFDIRNRIWIILNRRLGSTFAYHKAVGSFGHRLRKQWENSPSTWVFFYLLATGVFKGLTSRPHLKAAPGMASHFSML